jgi:RNA-directed DNA polymerase
MSKTKSLAWKEVDWAKVQNRVRRYQYRIFKASAMGNQTLVHKLQIKLVNSLDAKLVSIQCVTTLNQDKNTRDIDHQIDTTDRQKINLVYELKLDGKNCPIKKVSIPKLKRTEKKPLGITIIRDRAKQYLATLALEPEWEAVFESNSYGFRPGRFCYDAIEAIFTQLRQKEQFVLYADIAKCFYQIDHNALISKMNTFPLMEAQIRAWVKGEIMKSYAFRPKSIFENMENTQQGGIISPLLANIALHGLEDYLKTWYLKTQSHMYTSDVNQEKVQRSEEIKVIRYADDFVVIGSYKGIVESAYVEIKKWLKDMGLEFHSEKTNIRSSNEGFQFLGFNIITIRKDRQHKVKIHISRASKAKLIDKIGMLSRTRRASSAYQFIRELSPIIVDWGNYFKYCECSKEFRQMDNRIFNILRKWVFRRKSQGMSHTDLKQKYFPSGKVYKWQDTEHQDNWVLHGYKMNTGKKVSIFLPKLSWISSSKFIKVKDSYSPYNGDHMYWTLRLSSYDHYGHFKTKLIKRQDGRCNICGHLFLTGDILKIEHIVSIFQDRKKKLQVVHSYCHMSKKYFDRSKNEQSVT